MEYKLEEVIQAFRDDFREGIKALNDIRDKLSSMDKKLAGIERIDNKLGGIGQRFDNLDVKYGKFSSKMDTLIGETRGVKQGVKKLQK